MQSKQEKSKSGWSFTAEWKTRRFSWITSYVTRGK